MNFTERHIGSSSSQISEMLETVDTASLDELIKQSVPEVIRLKSDLDMPSGMPEDAFLNELKKLASKNKVFRSYIGMGYYNTHVPTVILRNILENPGWYTAYTPYQAEIAQGRMEALINFQTMVSDLTGMELANASLLDEGTAVAEAMAMLFGTRKGAKKKASKFLVDKNTFPQTLEILETRAEPMGIVLEITDIFQADLTAEDVFGIHVQYPNADGAIENIEPLLGVCIENGVSTSVSSDLLSLVLLKSPGSMGADVVTGSTQRFGVPFGYGGPHAAFFATKEKYKRQIPGRIIGVSKDRSGNPAFRMALQTREQHIKRERATSNICTAQVLLAVMAGMYGVYHGPDGLKEIALKTHQTAVSLALALESLGLEQVNKHYFDTLKVKISDKAKLKNIAEANQINLRYFSDKHVGISVDETTNERALEKLIAVFEEYTTEKTDVDLQQELSIPGTLQRQESFMDHDVFHLYHSEHEMLRYIKSLENKDLSLTHSMIPLGSCTMKLNSTTEMIPVTWPEFSQIHPFAPANQTAGYAELIEELEEMLKKVTGFSGVSLQPNSGAQGEYAGLMVIKAYHKNNDEEHRNAVLIPSSAHGTNPASAVMAGLNVVIVQCDERGNIDIDDLRSKAEEHSKDLAGLMVTYPSTHGVFEAGIKEICQIIHDHGGQVYMDGANMNAQVGLTSPFNIGADVCHLNLHKTFCIPHGGGGPGVGPIGVASHLVPFLPGHFAMERQHETQITAISAAPWGSAGILPISYAYIKLMGGQGLKKATQMAILNANYIKSSLEKEYQILYTGDNGRCAHEFIIDFREFKTLGIEVEDISKRLMDYGFHSPTVSFPVPGTMMIEPTESESKAELDRFIEAFLSIREEIREIEQGIYSQEDNVLKNAPHTTEELAMEHWPYSYSRAKAVFPTPKAASRKFWPSVKRIDNAYGDRNLYCSCIPTSEYGKKEEEPTA